jgi:hypothetical protein
MEEKNEASYNNSKEGDGPKQMDFPRRTVHKRDRRENPAVRR